jgi:hypothetical protein
MAGADPRTGFPPDLLAEIRARLPLDQIIGPETHRQVVARPMPVPR